MSDEIKQDAQAPEAESAALSNDDLHNITGGAAPKKIVVSAGVTAGNKLSGATPIYPPISK